MKIKQAFNVIDLPSTIDYEMPSGERLAAGKEAWGGVGKALSGVGGAITDFVAEKIRIDNELEFASSMNEFRQRSKDAEINLEKEPNEETHVPRLEGAISKIQGDIIGRAKRKEVQVALTKSFAQESATTLNAGREFAFKTYLAKAGGKYAQTLFEMQQQYVATDETNRARVSGEAETLIRATATSLGRDPDHDIRSWQKDSVIGAAKSDAIIDPKGTREKIQAGFYKGIPEVDKPSLIKMCDALEKEQEAEAQKVKIDTVTKDLMTRDKNDFDSMFKSLADPKFLKENNLTVQEGHAINTVLRSQQQNYVNEKQGVYHKTGQEAFVGLQKGTLTPQQLTTWVAKDEMTEEQGRIYRNALEAHANAGKDVKTDDSLFIHRFNQIKDAAGNTEKLMAVRSQLPVDAKNKLLAREAYVQLWNLTDSENDAVFKDEYFKMADRYFKQQLGFQLKVGAMGELMEVAPNPEASQAYFKAQLDLISAYKTDDKLRGEPLMHKAVEILIPHRMKLGEMLGGGKKEPPKPSAPTVMGEASPEAKGLLPDPKLYFKQHGPIPLRDKKSGTVYKTDGKIWWELKK